MASVVRPLSPAKGVFLELVPSSERVDVRRWLHACGAKGTRLALGMLRSHAHPEVARLMLGRRAARKELLSATKMAKAAVRVGDLGACACCGRSGVAQNVDGDVLCKRHLAPFDRLTARVA